jgi:hypothetical protein
MAVTPKNRLLIYERDSDRCCSCGSGNMKTLNHRVNRQMGGSKHRDNLANLITMCNGCNGALESDATFRESGILMGWKLQTWDDPLRTAAYFQWAREWRLLDDGGSYEVVEQRDIRTVLEGMDF